MNSHKNKIWYIQVPPLNSHISTSFPYVAKSLWWTGLDIWCKQICIYHSNSLNHIQKHKISGHKPASNEAIHSSHGQVRQFFLLLTCKCLPNLLPIDSSSIILYNHPHGMWLMPPSSHWLPIQAASMHLLLFLSKIPKARLQWFQEIASLKLTSWLKVTQTSAGEDRDDQET